MYKIMWISGSKIKDIFKVIKSGKTDDVEKSLSLILNEKIEIEGYAESQREKYKHIVYIYVDGELFDSCILRLYNIKRNDNFPRFAIIEHFENQDVKFMLSKPDNVSDAKIVEFS